MIYKTKPNEANKKEDPEQSIKTRTKKLKKDITTESSRQFDNFDAKGKKSHSRVSGGLELTY